MTGGSSSGAGAAVAAGVVPLAIGTDTAGSVRIPAALCGVVGFKPARDTLPVDGVFPLAQSLDHVGVLTATVADAVYAMEALSGQPTAGELGHAATRGRHQPGVQGQLPKSLKCGPGRSRSWRRWRSSCPTGTRPSKRE